MDDDLLDDETMVAALDAAEKALNNSTSTSSVALSLPPPPAPPTPAAAPAPPSTAVAGAGAGAAAASTPIQQPIPQKLPRGSSSILVSTRQVCYPYLTNYDSPQSIPTNRKRRKKKKGKKKGKTT